MMVCLMRSIVGAAVLTFAGADLATTITAVQTSWGSVQGVGGCEGTVVMDIFFPHLYNSSADVPPIFASATMDGTGGQKEYLWGMLNQAVLGLSDVDTLLPVLKALGARHIDYGVPTDATAAGPFYDLVGASLIYTLGQGLGSAFTVPLKDDWLTIYGIIKATMLEGGADATNTSVVPDLQLAKGTVANAANNPECATPTSAPTMLNTDPTAAPTTVNGSNVPPTGGATTTAADASNSKTVFGVSAVSIVLMSASFSVFRQ
jgi:nitric oxide dioxygenase